MTPTLTKPKLLMTTIPDNAIRFRLERFETRILARSRDAVGLIWENGRDLTEVKGILTHGQFMTWVEGNLSMSHSTALRQMAVYEKFPDLPAQLQAAPVGVAASVLYALAAPSVEEETRVVGLELAASGDITNASEAREFVAVAQQPAAQIRHSDEFEPASEREIEDAAPGDDADDWENAPDPFDDEGHRTDTQEPEPQVANPAPQQTSPAPVKTQSAPPPTVPVEDTRPLAERLKDSEVYEALSAFSHGASKFLAQAELMEMAEKAAASASRLKGQLRYNDGPVSDIVRAMADLPHWREWQGCATCHGSTRVGPRHDPCQSCRGAAFTIHPGQGVGPSAIRRKLDELGA